jgi:outer membrane protein TolC
MGVEALAQVLDSHTDMLAAKYRIQRVREDMRLARGTLTPDLDLQAAIQPDSANLAPGAVAVQFDVIPSPVWDGQKGNLRKAQAALVRETDEEHRVRAYLTARLADGFAQFESKRRLVEHYRDQVLPDKARAFAHVRRNRQEDPNRVTDGDLLNASQALATAATASNEALRETWLAAAAIVALLQTEKP